MCRYMSRQDPPPLARPGIPPPPRPWQLFGLFLSTTHGWRWLLGTTMIVGVVQLFSGPLLLESPKYVACSIKRCRGCVDLLVGWGVWGVGCGVWGVGCWQGVGVGGIEVAHVKCFHPSCFTRLECNLCRYLVSKSRNEEAVQVLKRLRGYDDRAAHDEVIEIQESACTMQARGHSARLL